ncbi:uncharacterized protein syne2b isoform X3 [Festucalex cinctus]
MVEQEQIQKRTFTNWVNVQLAKKRPPCRVVDLFDDFRDGSKLLDLLEVMSNQRLTRERGRGPFQHRSNIEKGLAFLRRKSIKLVNINVPDIIDGKPAIILGLIWTIILQYHIEELASGLSFSSRQSSMESLASLDSWRSAGSSGGGGGALPRGGSPLHARFKLSAKKALMLWVRQQCHKAGCCVNVKDFKGSWRSGVLFLAILHALRRDLLVDLSQAAGRSNKQNLDQAFRLAERELGIPRLLEPDDVDVREPDEKSIMTYVAQFLQYSKDAPVITEEDAVQASPERKVQEVSRWLEQAYEELLEGWDSTRDDSYSERYHVLQTFVVSFNEQRRPIMPLLSAVRRSSTPSEEQRGLRETWDALTEKLRQYKLELDVSLPAPLDAVARWLLRTEGLLAEEEGDPPDHGRAAEQAREKQEQLKVCLEEMPHQLKTFQAFPNQDEDGNLLVPIEKMEDLKRRFTSVRVSVKYHGIKLEYCQHRHTLLDLLGRIRTKVSLWKRPYLSPESVRLLLHDWHELVSSQELPCKLEAALHKVKQVSEKYSSKSALAADYHHVCQQVTQLEEDSAAVLAEVDSAKGTLGRVLSAWDSYTDALSSMQAWLEQASAARGCGSPPRVTSESVAEWGSRQAHLNEVANFLMESSDPRTSSALEEELLKLNEDWAEFVHSNTNTLDCTADSDSDIRTRPQNLQALVKEATLLLQEPVETTAAPLRTYRKRIQLLLRKVKEEDLEALVSSPEFAVDELQDLKLNMSEVKKSLCQAEQACAELQHSVSALDDRLAELLHWETEAGEMYRQLRAAEPQQQQPGQDPRARALISRGLQLEGQVVMEEQDLQALITSTQESSPIRYLQTAVMQERVRAALSQSQEAVGMLSSLGARRDGSRSPTGGPPSKVFIQDKSAAHQVRTSDTTPPSHESLASLAGLHPYPQTFAPNVVREEYADERTPFPHSAAEEIPIAGQTPSRTGMGQQQQTAEGTLLHQQLDSKMAQQQPKSPQPAVEAREQGERKKTQSRVHEEGKPQPAGEHHLEVETKLSHKTPARKEPQELQCKKAQAVKNRPWLQKNVQGHMQSPKKDSVQEPLEVVQPHPEKDVMGYIKEVAENPGAFQNGQQGKVQTVVVAQHEKKSTKEAHPNILPLEQSQPTAHILVESQAQLQLPTHGPVVAQGPTWAQVRPTQSHAHSVSQPIPLSLDHSQAKAEPVLKVQANAAPRPQSEKRAQQIIPHQTPPHPKYPTAMPQPQSSPVSITQAQTPSQAQRFAQPVTQSQAPLPSKAQSETYTQAVTKTGTLAQIQSSAQAKSDDFMPTQQAASAPSRFHSPPQSQAKLQPSPTLALTQGQPLVHPVAQYGGQSQPAGQCPGQPPVWAQVCSSSSMCMPPQASAQPHIQPQSPSQQWALPALQPPNQNMVGQRQHVPQAFPRPTFEALQAAQWAQAAHPPRPEMGHAAKPQSHTLPPMQPHPHTRVQPHALFQMQGHHVAVMQTRGGHVQQQMRMPAPHPVQTHAPFLQAQHNPHVEWPNMHAQLPRQPNQADLRCPTRLQLQPRPQPPLQTQVIVQPQAQLKQPQAQQLRWPAQTPTLPRAPAPSLPAYIPQAQPPAAKTKSLPQNEPEPQATCQLQIPTQCLAQSKPEIWEAPQPKFQSPKQPEVLTRAQCTPEQLTSQPCPQFQPASKPELQFTPQRIVPTAAQGLSVSKPSLETRSPQMMTQQPVKPATGPFSQIQAAAQSPAQASLRVNLLPQFQAPSHPKQPVAVPKSVHSVRTPLQPQADVCAAPPALAQAPPQAYSEAYAKAQALARNGFEEAKHCLQEHILEAISDQRLPDQQAPVTNSRRTLDPDLLEEFLRAAKGMEAFCTPAQLRDMELFTQSVRSQWEACFSSEGNLRQAGQQAKALKELCDMLIPEDAHRLAHTQLRECESSLAAIQRQFSGDHDGPPPESRLPDVLMVQQTPSTESASLDKLQIPTEVSQTKLKTVNAEQKVKHDSSADEDGNKKEAKLKYEHYKKSLQVQLSKNEQSIRDVSSDPVTLKDLHTRLQEIQFLRQDTESLWLEFMNQCSHLSGDAGLEQEKLDLQNRWQAQQSNLQRRGSSLGAALRQIDSTENHMVDFTDRLDRFLRQPKDVTAFSLADTNILKDIKELDENIQSELDQLARLDPESSNLDPRDCLPLSREVEAHRSSLDQLGQQVRKSEAAARALDHFLMSLRTVEEDIAGAQASPCSDPALLRACCAKLALIRQSVDSLKDKAPQLDLLLQGARLTVTRDGSPASCLDMVGVLLSKLEEADGRLVGQQRRETQSQSLGLRKRALLGELRKLQDIIQSRGLTEASVPAIQHRLRALTDLEGQLQAHNSEIQSLKELPECQGEGLNLLEELEAEYSQTETSLTDRKQQCCILIELLKTFQSCRSHVSGTVLRAEQAVSEQASYMGKDNLERILTKVKEMKTELSGLSEQLDDLRVVCKQLQSHLNKFPDCREVPFEAEAYTLMDSWLDVTEKIDAYADNLRVGLELWEKELTLGGEIEGWAASKLASFAEGHPFHNQQQVLAMEAEIQTYQDNIEHFHKKAEEIREMLQSQEAPLELQVTESQLRKRMEQVKELFADCADVFEELMVVKKHLAQKIEHCLSAVDDIRCSVNKVQVSEPQMENRLQGLCVELQGQEEQAESVVSEMALVSSVASPAVLEELSVDCQRLTDAVARAKDAIGLKREEKDKGLLKVIQDETRSFDDWFQDLQLDVNECFENPQSGAHVEMSLRRLTGFLKADDAERRLEQLRERLEGGRPQMEPQQLRDIDDWLKERREEAGAFKTHCLNRHQQMEALSRDLSSLQTQHDSLQAWLRDKEELSAAPGAAKGLLLDLGHQRQQVDLLEDLLTSVRRQGIRDDRILEEADNVIELYGNLEARLRTPPEEDRHVMDDDGRLEEFAGQAEDARAWLKEILGSFTSACGDLPCNERTLKAQAVLSAKAEGDSKMEKLQLESHSLCEQGQLDQRKKEEVQHLLRDLQDEWGAVLRVAEDVIGKATPPTLFHQEVEAIKAQSEHLRSWFKHVDGSLESGQILKEALLNQAEMQSKLQQLKEQGQSLCNKLNPDDGLLREIQDLIRATEGGWAGVMKTVEEAQRDASAALRDHIEAAQSWIRERRCQLLSLGPHMPAQERLRVTQAVFACCHEGECKVGDLKRKLEQVCEESEKPEMARLLEDTQQQWESLLHICQEAQVRSLRDDFEAHAQTAASWLRERLLRLQAVGIHTPPADRHRMAQDVLQAKPDGDCQVNDLRRLGQALFDRPDVSEEPKCQVQQAVKDAEQQWRKVLQLAQQLEEEAAVAQINQEKESRDSELREFQSLQQETERWLSDLQHQLDSLDSQAAAQERLRATQTIVSTKSDGDGKVQELKRRSRSLCAQEPELEPKLEKTLEDAEDRWGRIIRAAKAALDAAERQMARECRLKEHQEAREQVQAWLNVMRHNLDSVLVYKEPEVAVKTAQAILSSKPEGDCKLAELQKQCRDLHGGGSEEDAGERESGQALQALEELWAVLLRDADSSLNKAQSAYMLSREVQAFFSQASADQTWLEQLRTRLDSIGTDARGSTAQIEDRLNAAHMILSAKSSGQSRVEDLQKRSQCLCEHTDLEEDSRLQAQTKVQQLREQWTAVLQMADDTIRHLQSVKELLVSCHFQRGQAEARLAQLLTQTSNLPRAFPWPGLGERRQAAEQARTLLDTASTLGPLLLLLRSQAAELFEITQDPEWADSTCAGMEESISAVLKQLTEAVMNLEQGIVVERRVTQLLEQHQAAQHWLREQVKGLQAPPEEPARLGGAVNTLKALLQTVEREQTEMKDLDTAADDLLDTCTPGGRDALALEVSILHELCATSEQDLRERLTAGETRLREMDVRATRQADNLKERAAGLLWELSSLDQALGYARPQDDVHQLQQHWKGLQNCEKSLEDLSVHIDALNQEVANVSELPAELSITAESLRQQHDSLQSRLRQNQQSCSTNTARYLRHSLQALHDWSHSKPSEFSTSLQETADEGEKLQAVLGEALDHQDFLSDCLAQDVFEQLSKDIYETLREAGTLQMSLCQILKETSVRSEPKTERQPIDVDIEPEEAKTPLVAPSQKIKQTAPVQHTISTTDLHSPLGDTESAEVAQYLQGMIESDIRNIATGKGRNISPATKSNDIKFSPQLPQNEEPISESNLEPLRGKTHDDKGVCEEAMEDSPSAEACVITQFVTAMIESVVRHVDLLLEQDQRELEETPLTSQVATGLPQVGEISPATRSKNVTLTPLPEKEEPAVAKEDSARESKEKSSQDETEHTVCEEARKDSGYVETTAVAEYVTGLIESAMRDIDLLAHKASQVVTGMPKVVTVEGGKLSLPTIKTKSVAFSPKLPEKDLPVVPKEDSNLHPVEEKTQDDKEHRICEEAKDTASVKASDVAEFVTAIVESAVKVLPQKDPLESERTATSSASQDVGRLSEVADDGQLEARRTSKNVTQLPENEEPKEEYALEPKEGTSQDDKEYTVCEEAIKDTASVESSAIVEFVTAIVETAVDVLSQEGPLESERRATSSASQAVTGISEVAIVDEGKLSPTRRSKNVTLTPQLPEKGKPKEEYALEPKEAASQERTVCEETEFCSRKTSSAPQDMPELVTVAEGGNSPPKRKSKAVKLHSEDVTVTKQRSSNSGQEPTTPQPPKRKSKSSTASPGSLKKGLMKTKEPDTIQYSNVEAMAKSKTISPESPKLSTRRKSKKLDIPSVSTVPDVAISKPFGLESGIKPKAAVLGDRKLSPPKRKSKILKGITKEASDETTTVAVEESICEMVENDEATFSEAQVSVSEMILAEQTITSMQTVIELELLESTSERHEEGQILLELAVDDSAELEKSVVFLEGISGSTAVGALEPNTQNKVKDEHFSNVSSAEQKEPPVVLATLQPNATELIEIVLCDKAVEKTRQTETLVELVEIDPPRWSDTEEHEPSVSTGAFQDPPTTIHMVPDVHLLQIEIRAHQEEKKNKLETGTKERPNPADDMSPVEKQDTSTEGEKSGSPNDAVSVAFNPVQQPSVTEKDNVDKNLPQLIKTASERPAEGHISSASLGEQEEIQMAVTQEKEPNIQIGITTVDQGDIQPIKSVSLEESQESLTDAPSYPDPDKLPEDQKNNATKDTISTSIQKESGEVIWFEPQHAPHAATTISTFEIYEASIDQPELESDIPEKSRLTEIFSELKAIADTELLNEESSEDCLEELMTSPSSDTGGLLCRLVSNLLSCKNRSAELRLNAMSQQVKEAEKCRDVAQEQAALLCQQRKAEADESGALEYMENQWKASAQDAAAVIQNKVDHLELVQDYCQQNEKVQTTLERLSAELDVWRLSPAESCHEDEDRLNSIKRALEEKPTALGELLGIHAKLYPLLSLSHQAAAKNILQIRRQEWRGLETEVQKALHHMCVQSQSCGSLLLEFSYLRGHLEAIGQELEAQVPEGSLWDCKEARQLIMAHAEVKAAQVKYNHLKERSEALPPSLWPKEREEIKKALLNVKDQLCLTEEWISSQIQRTDNPVIKEVMKLGRDGLSWLRQLESDIEGKRSRVPLLPEAVHQQLMAFKKLQFQVTDKQKQLDSQVKAASELLPQLDQCEEMPIMRSVLQRLEELSKSVTEELSKAVKDIESGLQFRDKLAEEIADLDSWVVTYLQRETIKTIRKDFMSAGEIEHSGLEIQEMLVEVEKQSTACEVLLMKSKDIVSELSIAENLQLFSKLANLQEDIDNIRSHERANRNELDEHIRSVDSNKRELDTVEKSLRQMQDDLNQLRFPVPMQFLASLKNRLLEHRSKIDHLQSWIQEGKTKEFYLFTAKLYIKLTTLQLKAREHEKYLNMRQNVEDIREAVEEQLCQTKDGRQVEEQYKTYHKLLFHFPLIERLCKEIGSKLGMISTDLYPAQLCAEQQRLQQNQDSFTNLEMKTLNILSIVECSLIQELDLDTERKGMRAFLWDAQQELQKPALITPNETWINKEFQKILFLKKTVESRMRALEVLEHIHGNKEGTGSSDLEDLKNCVLRECDAQMDNISDARTSLRNYTRTVKHALQFLRDFEVSVLPLPALFGVCCEKLEETQEILASVEDHFKTHVEQLSQVDLHPFLSTRELEHLQQSILSQILARMSTLKAKGYLQMENLSSCAEKIRKYAKCHEEITLSVRKAEASLEHFASHKVTSLTGCTQQLQRLEDLCGDLNFVHKQLEEMVEWCPEQMCRGRREIFVAASWRRMTELRLCSLQLAARLKQAIVEWNDVTGSVAKAFAALQQLEGEFPEPAPLMASFEELVGLQHCWEQYQDQLDCQHGALSSLELRVARLLGVPANLEQAPPTPICQQLQMMQATYSSVKQRSREGLERIKLELQEKQTLQEELHVVWVWLTAADSALSEMDPSSTAELKELHSQLCAHRVQFHRIRDRLKAKDSESGAVPAEIDGQLQDIQKTLEQVKLKVEEAMEKSGPVQRIGAKLLETQAGLISVQEMLEDRSPNVAEAKLAQKLVWDELQKWHSRVVALQAEVQGLESPREALSLTGRLAEVQQLDAQLAERAEHRTTLISKTQVWLEEHREMIHSSKTWMSETKLWMLTPHKYITSKCLHEQAQALQVVLNDSVRIRSTLESFITVVEQMSQVVEVSVLRDQLAEADQQLAGVQDSFATPLLDLEHASVEVSSMETKVKKMEKSVAEIKSILCSLETLPSPKEKYLKMAEEKIQSMRSRIADMQKARLDLRLPENAEETLTVFKAINQLQALLLDLEKKVPALFIQQLPPQRAQVAQGSRPQGTSPAELELSSSEEEDPDEPVHFRVAPDQDEGSGIADSMLRERDEAAAGSERGGLLHGLKAESGSQRARRSPSITGPRKSTGFRWPRPEFLRGFAIRPGVRRRSERPRSHGKHLHLHPLQTCGHFPAEMFALLDVGSLPVLSALRQPATFISCLRIAKSFPILLEHPVDQSSRLSSEPKPDAASSIKAF